mgnify:CR=1 FL=1
MPASALPRWAEPLFNAEQMRAVDGWAINERGVPSLELMEAAGRAVAVAVVAAVTLLPGAGASADTAADQRDVKRQRAQVAYRLGDMVAPTLPEGEALQGVVAELAASIREGRAPLTDGRAGLRVLELLEAASRSLETGGGFVELEEVR